MNEKNLTRYVNCILHIRKALESLDNKQTITIDNIYAALDNLRIASAQLQALEQSMKGIPEPKTGDEK